MRVIVTNGFKNFHLSSAASELDKRGLLLALFNGIYPTAAIRKAMSVVALSHRARFSRLLHRAVSVNEERVYSFVLSDLLVDISVRLAAHQRFGPAGNWLNYKAMQLFAAKAAKLLKKLPAPTVYHYRAGFGGASVRVAKKLGAITVCDHSIAHPRVLEGLVNSGGQLPPPCSETKGIWRLVQADIERADHVLVNSEFVRESFTYAGCPSDKVSVIYLGVDDAFLATIPDREPRTTTSTLRLLFAGTFTQRKGAEVLADAIARLPPDGWKLEIAGPVSPDMKNALQRLLQTGNVEHLGNLSRPELARAMSRADVFVFPSLAEGSARVVFEALACGCAVITTPNTGSIVKDRVHGSLVPAGNSDALYRALKSAMDDPDLIGKQGIHNSNTIRENYTQHAYGENLIAFYRSLT